MADQPSPASAPKRTPSSLPAPPAPLPPDVCRTVVDALATALVAEVQGENTGLAFRGPALHNRLTSTLSKSSQKYLKF
jgi:hypothetical protein